MDRHDQPAQQDIKSFLTPSIGPDGEWRSSGALALQQSLRLGSEAGAMEILNALDARTAAACLREVGFSVPESAIAQGHDALMAEIHADFAAAIDARVDGVGLSRMRMVRTRLESGVMPSAPKANLSAFAEATQAIQRVMRSEHIEVQMAGEARADERESLLFVAGQALQKRVQGFAFEGIPGKYDLPISMPTMVKLHREAARAVGEDSARAALSAWVSGEKVTGISEWVPDSVQKLLYGSVSLESASRLVEAIKGGAVGHHASTFGSHGFAALMAEQGFDVNAKTVAMQAAEMGLEIVEPDRQRGQYVGPMLGSDHRAALVKFNRHSALELPFDALGPGQDRPKVGDRVRMGFKNGALTVGVAPSIERAGVGR